MGVSTVMIPEGRGRIWIYLHNGLICIYFPNVPHSLSYNWAIFHLLAGRLWGLSSGTRNKLILTLNVPSGNTEKEEHEERVWVQKEKEGEQRERERERERDMWSQAFTSVALPYIYPSRPTANCNMSDYTMQLCRLRSKVTTGFHRLSLNWAFKPKAAVIFFADWVNACVIAPLLSWLI